jgi:UDP:flavonoid glycosyltransferase YjiC (YdhE family)
LILPANPDQILVAQQAQALDMGYNMRRPGGLPVNAGWQRALTPAAIRGAVDRLVLDRRCAEACRAFKRQLDACCAAPAAAEILEGIAR